MKRSDEAGISVVEIMIATFILFLVITALAGLLTMAFAMTATARKQTEGTAFLQRTMEQVRALPWTSIGTQGGNPNGVLPATETTVSGDTTFTIVRDITWKDDPADNPAVGEDSDPNDYKRVSTTVGWRNPNGFETSLTAMTLIRKPWANSNPPSVVFADANVRPNSIVYGEGTGFGSIWGASMVVTGTLFVQASAEDTMDADGMISSLVFYVDGRILRNLDERWSESERQASWAPATQTFTNDPYPWDTMTEESGTPLYPDGMRELKVEAWDNSGARDFKIINVVIDNYPPPVPTPFLYAVSTLNRKCFDTINLGWPMVKDGTDWADHYEIARIKNDATATVLTVPGTIHGATETSLTPITPATKYEYRIRSVSPRGLTLGWTTAEHEVVTRLKLTGTLASFDKKDANRTVTLSWTPPTLPSPQQLHYHIYRVENSWNGSDMPMTSPPEIAATWNKHTSPGYYTSTTYTSESYDKSKVYYWQVRASFTSGGDVYSLYSNVIGPSNADITQYPIP